MTSHLPQHTTVAEPLPAIDLRSSIQAAAQWSEPRAQERLVGGVVSFLVT